VAATAAVIAAAVYVGRGPSAQSTPLPFTFYLTHYELLGDQDDPSWVRNHSSGRPFAKARDGSRIILTGHDGWDPASARATGGGEYTNRDHVKAALADAASCGLRVTAVPERAAAPPIEHREPSMPEMNRRI
jgi:hypothetical protein